MEQQAPMFERVTSGRIHLPKRRWKRSSFAQTTQWMGLSGVLRMVHTGNDLGGGFERHS